MPSEWDNGASTYATGMAAFTGKFAAVAAALLVERLTQKKIESLVLMDAAAGTGASTFALTTALKKANVTASTHILATDISEGMLAELESKVPSHQTDSITIKTAVMSLNDLAAQPDNSLDGLLCVFGIMFVQDGAHAAAAIKRVLKPGGTAVVVTWKSIRTSVIMSSAAVAQGIMKPEDKPNYLVKMLQFGCPAYITEEVLAKGGVDGPSTTFHELAHGDQGDALIPFDDFIALSQTCPRIAGGVAPHKFDGVFLENYLKESSIAVTVDGKLYVPLNGEALVTEITK